MGLFTKQLHRRSATLALIARKQVRQDLNPVRQFWRLTALPGARTCIGPAGRPTRRGTIHFASSTFQYASLMNFDQLSSRVRWSAYTGLHVGHAGPS